MIKQAFRILEVDRTHRAKILNHSHVAEMLDLHGWAFDRFTNILEYKVEGINVVEVSERDTSKTCCICGRVNDSQRVEPGLYVCEACDAAFIANVNGAENIRLDMNQRNSESSARLDEDRSTDWLASQESTSMTSPEDRILGHRC